MFKKLDSVSALLSFTVLVVTATSVMSQPSKTPTQRALPGSIPVLSREILISPKAAVVAVKREGRVQLAGDKQKVTEAMQRALNNGKEPGVVRDIRILSLQKANYLALQIEKQGTLYLQLQPSNGGVQGIFYVGDLNSLYCSGGCGACKVVPSSLSQGTGPQCSCAEENQAPLTDCKLYPRRNVGQLVAQFNHELLAIGFEVTDGGAAASEGPNVVKEATRETRPGRTDPIKRPN
jgi:hypothetical protein